MGYRHYMMTGTVMGYDSSWIPEWYKEKYSFINFEGDSWHTPCEQKRYGVLKDFETDTQLMLKETKYGFPIEIIFFADENGLHEPDVSYVVISEDYIKEYCPEKWVEQNKEFYIDRLP